VFFNFLVIQLYTRRIVLRVARLELLQQFELTATPSPLIEILYDFWH